MFILADDKLIQFARRVADDLPPEVTVVGFEPVPSSPNIETESPLDVLDVMPHLESAGELEIGVLSRDSGTEMELKETDLSAISPAGETTPSLSLFGRFMEELIVLKAAFRT